MAGEKQVMEQLRDMTECCICTGSFVSPKVLPCVHTFCLKCLRASAPGKQPGDKMPCPLCRKLFEVPADGIAGLPNNFFMQKLVDMSKSPSGAQPKDTLPCDVCVEKEITESADPAIVFCVECQKNICDGCHKDHQKQKVTKSHQTVSLGGGREEVTKFKSSYCEKHATQKMKIYCNDCKTSICIACYNESHRSHNCSDVNRVASDIRKLLQEDIDKVAQCIQQGKDKLKKLEKEKATFVKQLKTSKKLVIERGEALKQMIEDQTQTLLQELIVLKQTRLKEMENEANDAMKRLSILDSYKTYVKEMKIRGSACDVSFAGHDLHAKADELQKLHKAFFGRQVWQLQICFKPSEDLELEMKKKNLVGKIEELRPSCRHLAHLEAPDRRVWGVAALLNRLYVVCWQSNTILVYEDREPFAHLDNVQITRIRSPRDIAACAKANCLYITDYNRPCVWKVKPSSDYKITRWLAGIGDPWTLSVTDDGDVLVFREARPALLELYDMEANLVKRIQLPAEIESPHHAVVTSTGSFIVSHGTTDNRNQRICELTQDGRIVRTYQHTLGRPFHLALDTNSGRLFVADIIGSRVLLLHEDNLGFDHILLGWDQHGIRQPGRLCYSRESGHLLVGHRNGVDIYKVLVDVNESQ